MNQFGKLEGKPLAISYPLYSNDERDVIGLIDQVWDGTLRELANVNSGYTIRFEMHSLINKTSRRTQGGYPLEPAQRAVLLGCAIRLDLDRG